MPQLFESALDADACSVECLHPKAIAPLLGRTLSRDGATGVAALFEPLADPSRARVLHAFALTSDELCVCDIALLLGMTVSALSHQLRWLRERGIVTRRKQGRMVFYRLADERLRALVIDGAEHVVRAA